MTTPTHLSHLAKLVQAVTTSTPTHPACSGWSMFSDGQGADSPLSEIENAESPAQSTVTDINEVYFRFSKFFLTYNFKLFWLHSPELSRDDC